MIPPEIIDQVRDRADIVAIIRESVPSLKKRGRAFVGLCPFHQEKTGSFHVNPDRSFFHCLSAETGVILRDGVRPISSLAGTTQTVLTRGGKWVEAIFKSYGYQRLYRIELTRNGLSKVLHATSGHRWFVYDNTRDVLTSELRPGHRLESVLPVSRHDWSLDPAGVAHGIVFGDGSVQKGYGHVNLHGEKQQLADWFIGRAPDPKVRDNGSPYLRIYGGKAFGHMKTLPSLDRSEPYLLGFLAGYLATDGHVAKDGTVMLHSAKRDHLEWVRSVATRLGLGTMGITSAIRRGYGNKDTEMFRIHFVYSTLDSTFFLRQDAKRRFEGSVKAFDRLRWAVKSVEDTNREEEVYCAEVPEEYAFAIEDNILTGNCFGCREQGGVIDFLMKQDGYTFPEAVRALAERLGIVVEERDIDPKERDEAVRAKKHKDDLYAVNALAATYWEQQLHEHPQRQYALDELTRRGLFADATVDETLKAFRIGYAPSGWEGFAEFLRAQNVSPVLAETVGILVPNKSGSGYHDRFRHRLMFAVIDPQGRVIAFSGRALPPIPEEVNTSEKRDPPAKYINSPESPIYSKGNTLFGLYRARNAIRNAGVATLVEGNFDVVSLHAHGIQNVVAPLGTAFTSDQATMLTRYAREFIILFDADTAGDKATRAARETLKPLDVSVKVASLPRGKDPDDFVRERGPIVLLDAIKQARGMTEHLLQSTLDASFSGADAHEKADRINYVLKLLVEENDPVVRSLHKAYADRLASRLDITRAGTDAMRALQAQVKKALAAAAPKPVARAQVRVIRPPGSEHRMAMCGALIEFPALLQETDVQTMLDLLEGPSAQIVAWVASTLGYTEETLAQLPEALRSFAVKRLAAPEHDTIEFARDAFIQNSNRLRAALVERETTDAARELEGIVGDDDESIRIAQEASDKRRTDQSHR